MGSGSQIKVFVFCQLANEGKSLQIEEIPFSGGESELFEAATRPQRLEEMHLLVVGALPAAQAKQAPM